MTKHLLWLSVLSIVLIIALPVAAAEITLPNGAKLDVFITTPITSTEFLIPTGETTIPLEIDGTASIGMGDPDATFVYVIDVSGSTDDGSGTGCAPVLSCERNFILLLNENVVNSGSASDIGTVVFGMFGAAADMDPAPGKQLLISPTADEFFDTVVDSIHSWPNHKFPQSGVWEYTFYSAGVSSTNFASALQEALTIVTASTKNHKIVVFVSDGGSNDGDFNTFTTALTDLNTAGVKIYSIAIGTDNSCTDGSVGTLQDMADYTGGRCFEVEDPGNLPDIISELVGTEFMSLDIVVDDGPTTPISNVDPSIPHSGKVGVTYTANIPNLGPGDHVISVTATGKDLDATMTVTDEKTIHLYQITLDPIEATNDLGTPGQKHTVTATILGPLEGSASVAGRAVTFSILWGPNENVIGTCSPHSDCTTDETGKVAFTYPATQGQAGFGTDTIQASFTLNDPTGVTGTVTAIKNWADTTPPVPVCKGTVNPAGKQVPKAGSSTLPGAKGGQNEDGFYQLTATDVVDPMPNIFVKDAGSGTVFGPFTSGTNIKYTQAQGATPVKKSIGGPKSAVAWHIIGTGDPEVYAVDASGNTALSVACLVPPPPK